MTVNVTRSAAKRRRERVCLCTYREATAQIMAHSTVIETAAAFGADTVKLGTNHRLKLAGTTVLTVLPHGAR